MTSPVLIPDATLDRAIDAFWATIPPLWGQVRGRIRATAAERFDLSFEQFHILRHVRRGVDSVSELAEVKQISRPAVSQAVETLVACGLLSRQQSTEDRRFVRLALTPAGDELLDAHSAATRAWMAERLADLTPEELAAVVLGMDALKRAFIDTPRPND
jgi:DNA-binding MarR family transcriptional regulator